MPTIKTPILDDAGKIVDASLPLRLEEPSLKATYAEKFDRGLRRFQVALGSRDVAPVNIWFGPGDSITEGQGATTISRRWQARAAAAIRARFPVAGVTGGAGAIPAFYEATTIGQPGTTSGAVVKSTSLGLGGRGYAIPSGGYLEWNVTGSSADIIYALVPGSDSITVSVDGVDAGTFTGTTTGATTDGKLYRVTFGSVGAHTVRVRSAGANHVRVDGIVVYNGDETKGVRFYDASKFGTTSGFWAGGGADGNSLTALAAAMPPNLVVMTLGANDYALNVDPATFKANLLTTITKIRAGASPSFLLMGIYLRGGTYTYPWSDYQKAMREIADADLDISYIDLEARMPAVTGDTLGLYTDTVHLSDKGNGLVAGIVEAQVKPS